MVLQGEPAAREDRPWLSSPEILTVFAMFFADVCE
jgi:hypothetical protein